MVKFDELLSELRHRSLDERLSILEFLTQTIKDEVKPAQTRRGTPAENLLGIARPDGPLPTDEEMDELRFRDLLQKLNYSCS